MKPYVLVLCALLLAGCNFTAWLNVSNDYDEDITLTLYEVYDGSEAYVLNVPADWNLFVRIAPGHYDAVALSESYQWRGQDWRVYAFGIYNVRVGRDRE